MAVIKKDMQGGRGTYATLAAVMRAVDELGYEVRWTTRYEGENGERMYVNTLRRRKGTQEWEDTASWFPAVVGDIKGMSYMQALGSAVTYARRYSTCGAFGIATTDDDGQTSGAAHRSEAMNDEQKQLIDALLDARQVPDGMENRFLSQVLQQQVNYATLTKSQATRVLERCPQAQRQEGKPHAE